MSQKRNYSNTYYNFYKGQYSLVPPQFEEMENYIMRFQTKLPYYAYSGNSLTVIYFNTGKGSLIVDGKKLKVSNQKFIILNSGSNWEYINSEMEDIDVLSLVLSKELLSKLQFFVNATSQQLLDSPFETHDQNPFFVEQCFNVNYYISGQLLGKIYENSNVEKTDALQPDEISMEVLQTIVKDQNHFHTQSKKIEAIKTSTQIEVMKRLLVAYEYIHDNLTKNISIKELAVASALSEFHLYNSFKNVFGTTPHQYMNTQKMNKAKEMLQSKSVTVSEVSTILNYPDLPTFSKLFKRTFGESPSHLIP